jgi:hypothetical protein
LHLLAIKPRLSSPWPVEILNELSWLLTCILDIKTAIAKIKNNKAPKDGEVTDDTVKAVEPIRMQQIYRIRRKIWQSNQMLDECTKGVMVLMY